MSTSDRPQGRPRYLLFLPWCLTALVGVVALRRGGGGGAEQSPAGEAGRTETKPEAALLNSPIQPIPLRIELDERKVALGRKLFHDARLSRDGTISCSTCHDVDSGGDDGLPVSVGVGGAQGAVNAPTVLNSGFNFRQFWDGRAASLEDQVDGPIQHPAEMAMDWRPLVEFLERDAGYAQAFREAFAAEVTPARVREAIATYERSLITPNGAFDRFLRGDSAALSPEARAGYDLFVTLGCVTCHQGVNTGGNMFQPLGKEGAYFGSEDREISTADLGRYNVTGDERDRHAFKVPTLRNVHLTAPYFHDGSVATLEEAVQIMARVQLGEDLSQEELANLVAFLEALSGPLPRQE